MAKLCLGYLKLGGDKLGCRARRAVRGGGAGGAGDVTSAFMRALVLVLVSMSVSVFMLAFRLDATCALQNACARWRVKQHLALVLNPWAPPY